MKPVGLVLVIMAGLLAGCRKESGAAPSSAPSRREPPAATRIVPRSAPLESFADVVERVTPAVVTIRSARRSRGPRQFPFFNDPLFERFFGGGNNRQAPPQATGLGSGVIVSNDGHILTNHHVIDGAEQITIEMQDRRTGSAELVGSDPPSDLALLKMDLRNLPLLELGNSDDVRVGDVVLAVGNPLGIGQTVTMGIISAKGRATGLSDGSFEDFLQTDAPINRGNSGGALVNTNGELVGINSQILSPTGANIGIGFAIPSNMARNVWDQIQKNGRVSRGRLGIQMQGINREIAEKLQLKDSRGVLVVAVERGGPADRAGLKAGDVIIALDGDPVVDSNAFRIRVSSASPGSDVTLAVLRDGREQQIRARLGEFEPAER